MIEKASRDIRTQKEAASRTPSSTKMIKTYKNQKDFKNRTQGGSELQDALNHSDILSQTSKANRNTVDIKSNAGGKSAKLVSRAPYVELRKQADLVSEANS